MSSCRPRVAGRGVVGRERDAEAVKSSLSRPGSTGDSGTSGGSGRPSRSESWFRPSLAGTQSGSPTTGSRGSPRERRRRLAVRHARVGVGDRPGEPAVDALHLVVREVAAKRHPAVGVALEVRVVLPARDVPPGAGDRVGHQPRAVLRLAVVPVGELQPLVDRVVGAALGLGGAHGVLGPDVHRAGGLVGDGLQRRQVVARDQVVALEELGVQPEVDEVGERLGVGRVGDVVEPDHGHVVVGVAVRVAGGRAVVGQRRAERVAVGLVELAHRRAHPAPASSPAPPSPPRSPCARRSRRRSGCRTRPGRSRRPRRWTSRAARSGCGSPPS